MRLDALTYGGPLDAIGDQARQTEQDGCDGWFVGETRHDPLLACVAASDATEHIEIGTAITVAFPRSPLQVAHAAHDLQALSRGRFVLGLGSQVRVHIEKRFGARWERPVPRMREYVRALRAIWTSWRTGDRLGFRGEFTRHTLMTPFFTPPSHPYPDPKVWIAAVGPRMTRVCGEVADGVFCHPLTSPRYVEGVTIPALVDGARSAGRARGDLEVNVPVMAVTGADEPSIAVAERRAREQIAFYGSTPAYRGVLELHGWGDLHTELHELSVAGRWAQMRELVDDEVLHTFAVVGSPTQVGAEIRRRYSASADRISLEADLGLDSEQWAQLRDAVRTSDAGEHSRRRA